MSKPEPPPDSASSRLPPPKPVNPLSDAGRPADPEITTDPPARLSVLAWPNPAPALDASSAPGASDVEPAVSPGDDASPGLWVTFLIGVAVLLAAFIWLALIATPPAAGG